MPTAKLKPIHIPSLWLRTPWPTSSSFFATGSTLGALSTLVALVTGPAVRPVASRHTAHGREDSRRRRELANHRPDLFGPLRALQSFLHNLLRRDVASSSRSVWATGLRFTKRLCRTGGSALE